MNWANILNADTNLGKLNVNLRIIMVNRRRDSLDYGTLTLGVSHNWFDELSKLIEWFFHADSDWIFDLMANLLCIFDIFWVFTAVVLFKKDVLLLVPTEKVLELGFPKSF